MTREQAYNVLAAMNYEAETDEGWDQEAGHADADEVLCKLLTSLGYGDVVTQWKKLPKWYA